MGEEADRAGDERIALNNAAWDERVPIHVASSFYDIESFRNGRNSLRPFELAEVGDVSGKTLCHLQCHFGQDTLSWARLGATVVGLDFSEPAVEAARQLATEIGVDAEFVHSNVYAAADALGRRRFDVVYTGLGALCWLPDIVAWARVCAELVAPGGVFYLAEFHPIHEVLAVDELRVESDYFTRREGRRFDEPGTYVDYDADTNNNVTYEWTHPVSSVISALLGAGLQLELFHEYDFTLWDRWPFLEARPDGTFHMPDDRPRLPLMYTVRARRPH